MGIDVSELTLADAARELYRYELANDLSSRDFYARFRCAEFIGSRAAMRWATFYEMHIELLDVADPVSSDRESLLIPI